LSLNSVIILTWIARFSLVFRAFVEVAVKIAEISKLHPFGVQRHHFCDHLGSPLKGRPSNQFYYISLCRSCQLVFARALCYNAVDWLNVERRMMTLEECLQQLPWRTIAAIAQAQALAYTHRHDKPTLCARLAAAIVDPERWQATWHALSPEAQAALRALSEADGLMRQEVFTARFGPIRPYKPWRDDAPAAPWENPASPAEELAYCGLIFVLNQGSKRRPLWVVLLPDEVKAVLTPPPAPSPLPSLGLGRGEGVPPEAGGRGEVSTAVLTFLCFLQREDLKPLHGRWLPPSVCRTLAPHLSAINHRPSAISHQPSANVRSERQWPYLSFVHYLAERAGLVDLEGEWLKPTLVAQTWLAQPLAERLRALWEAWREDSEANAALWSRFGLPGDSDLSPLARFNRLLDLLASLSPGAYALDDLVAALARREPALLQPGAPYRLWAAMDQKTQAAFRRRARRWVAEMLSGPLAWFGATSHTQYLIPNSQLPVPHSPSPLCFTPLGAALVGRDDGTWPADPPPAHLHLHPPTLDGEGQPTAVLLTVPSGLAAASRLALAGLTEEDDQDQRLTPRSLARALHRGHTVEGLVAWLEELSGEPLSPAVLKALYTWAEAVEAITIAPVLLLRVRDAALLQELAANRRLRARLGETLSARAVTVEADQGEALLRHLERLGFYPRVESVPAPGGLQIQAEQVSAGERVAVAAALRLFVTLADELGLDLRAPHLLAQRWLEGLSQAQRDAACRQVQTVLEALRHHDDRRGLEEYRLPSPTAPLLPELERAIAQGATIEIEYHTAGRGHLLSRRVDPLRLEWRGGVPYLVAFCHLRQEARTFRVDRIERISESASQQINES